MSDLEQKPEENTGRQCYAFSRKTWNRCGRMGEWRFFCSEHKMFPLYLVFILVFTVGSGLITYYKFLSVPKTQRPPGRIVEQLTQRDGEFETENPKIDVPAKFEKNGFRFRYLQLNDASQMKSLAEGRLVKDFPEMFETEPFLVKNEVYGNLLKLIPEISEYSSFLVSKDFDFARIKSKFETDPNYYVENPVFQKGSEESCPARADYALGLIGAQNFADLAGKYKIFPSLFNNLMQKNPDVPDVGLERLVLIECECEWELEFYFRPVKLIVLDIENFSNTPRSLTSVTGSVIRTSTYSLNAAAIEGQTDLEEGIINYPVAVLKPGERLLIPLAVLLASVSDQAISPDPESIPNTIPGSRFILDESGKEISMPRKNRNPKFHNEYFIGSAFLPTKVNGAEAIRPFDRKSLVYQGSFGIGSCPFVFTYIPKHRRWFQIGTAITKMKGKENEGVSILKIPLGTNGTIKIKELEDEVSYLDQVYLAIEFENGERGTVASTISKLRHRDGIYLTLKKGQLVELNFALPKRKVKNIELVTTGYFVLTSSSNS